MVECSTRQSNNSKLLKISRLERVFAKSHEMTMVQCAVYRSVCISLIGEDWAWGGSEIVWVGQVRQVRSDHMRAVRLLQQGKARQAVLAVPSCWRTQIKPGSPHSRTSGPAARTHALTQPALTPPPPPRPGVCEQARTCGMVRLVTAVASLLGPSCMHQGIIIMLIHTLSSSAEVRATCILSLPAPSSSGR